MSKFVYFDIMRKVKVVYMKKLNFQKIFCFLSLLFIFSCCIFYGTRFAKYYLKNRKIEIAEKNSLIKVVKENNQNNENFKSVNGQNYFTNQEEGNYLMYSNILWRIIKINSDNSITAIANNSLTSLAYGKDLSYQESYIYKWLNKTDDELSGILENSLNNKEKYLDKTITCTDIIDELTNDPCKNSNTDNYLTLLSVTDYLNIGSKDSYLSNEEYYYLSNSNKEGLAWYVKDDGTASITNKNDIIGIRPVITIKANIDYISGNGTQENPYKIENENALFGSYVKLDNDIWRIYQVNDNEVKLMLNDYLKINNDNLTYKYSNNSSYYDDYTNGSIAYYLNHTYLSSLSYKNIIQETNWTNGTYNNNYDYKDALTSEINSKVALMSIGNIYLNSDLFNYYTMTGAKDKGKMIYTITKDKKLYTKQIGTTANVVPTISINKDILTKGNGTIDSPYEME